MILKTKRRKYMKPAIQVYKMLSTPMILVGSEVGGSGLEDYEQNEPQTWP